MIIRQARLTKACLANVKKTENIGLNILLTSRALLTAAATSLSTISKNRARHKTEVSIKACKRLVQALSVGYVQLITAVVRI